MQYEHSPHHLFFGVSDRLIKDYNLSFFRRPENGLAISNLIFFQVTAKLKFVLPPKIICQCVHLEIPCSNKTVFMICPVTQSLSFSLQKLGKRWISFTDYQQASREIGQCSFNRKAAHTCASDKLPGKAKLPASHSGEAPTQGGWFWPSEHIPLTPLQIQTKEAA